jgi:uncharacterized protein involved in response to NO
MTMKTAAHTPWHWTGLLLAPHRLGFFLAMLVLGAASGWWALVQWDRSGAGLQLSYAVSPSVIHAAVMTYGFMPLFFAGFLFTAGPKWLGVRPPAARELVAPLSLQVTGWLAWLIGGHLHFALALLGLAVALSGLAMTAAPFWRLIIWSPATDRLHAKAIGIGLLAGCVTLAGVGVAVALDADAIARAFLASGLWAFIVVTFVSVAHRMIPFFTSSAVPMVRAWRPFWVLWLLLAVAILEAVAPWIDLLAGDTVAWPLLRAVLELAAGVLVLWLAVAWGLVQSLKIRLLAMLHLGFLWLGVGLLLAAFTHAAFAFTGEIVLPLAFLHTITMGCLGSLMFAMVTRVSCGHSGRPLVADNIVWTLFWLLQAAVALRIAATLPGSSMQALLVAAATIWAASMLVWGARYGSWYGQRPADGRHG